MKAMILAAGYGTRLRPITDTVPKPLVPLCNRPLIAYVADSLLEAGVMELVVNLHHLHEPLERFLRTTYDIPIHFSYEPEILGTGGGLRRVRSLLEGEEDFFLVNGDTIQRPPYERLRESRRGTNAIAALALRHPPADDRFTPVHCDRGLVTGFGRGRGEALMFSGAHCIGGRIFDHLPARDFSGIVEDVYQPLLDSGAERIVAVVDDGLWFDIGTPVRYLAASRMLAGLMSRGEVATPHGSRAGGGNVVHETARVTGRIEGSVVGARSRVEGELHASAVWDDCHIAAGAVLESCIVMSGVTLDRPLRLSRAILCSAGTPAEKAAAGPPPVIAPFR